MKDMKNEGMSDELLIDVPPCDSPRLAWMKKHGVSTLCNDDVQPGDECEFSGERLSPWCAYDGEFKFPKPNAGYGDTEDEALADWARKNSVRLWNEPAKDEEGR